MDLISAVIGGDIDGVTSMIVRSRERNQILVNFRDRVSVHRLEQVLFLINLYQFGMTALHHAVIRNRELIAICLLENEADVNARDLVSTTFNL